MTKGETLFKARTDGGAIKIDCAKVVKFRAADGLVTLDDRCLAWGCRIQVRAGELSYTRDGALLALSFDLDAKADELEQKAKEARALAETARGMAEQVQP